MRSYAMKARALSCLALSLAMLLTAVLAFTAPKARGDSAGAAAQAEMPYGEKFGVNAAHLKIKDISIVERELAAMHEAGIGWVRFDFDWIFVEPSRGVWDFSVYDQAVALASSYDIDILGLLASCPQWANGENGWNYPPTDMEAWRGYVRRVVSLYKGKVAAWEIWNEENIHAFWQPNPDYAAYVELLRNASEEIRAADPAAKVVMGGVAGLDPDYLNNCLGAGAADYVDAIAIHPYPETLFLFNYMPQESRCRYIVDWVRNTLLPQHTTKPIELWITEVGWTTSTLSPPGVSEDTQADYMLRTLINYAGMEGADRVFYYDMWDEAAWAFDPMSNFGLLRYDFTPRDSYRFYRTMQAVLGDARSRAGDLCEVACGSPGSLEAHAFRLAGGHLALAVWKADDTPDTMSFTILDTELEAGDQIDLMTAEPSPIPGLTRDELGRLTASGLAIGKRPVLFVFSAPTPDVPEPDVPEPTPAEPPEAWEPEPPSQSPPTTGPSADTWYLAEGCTAGGFETWVLVQNPGDEEVDVTLTFMTDKGEVPGPTATLAPRSRRTFNAGEYVSGYDVSTRVTSSGGVICERSMYWGGDALHKAGHNSTGSSG